jgi:hypothetical protein
MRGARSRLFMVPFSWQCCLHEVEEKRTEHNRREEREKKKKKGKKKRRKENGKNPNLKIYGEKIKDNL